MNQRTAKNSLFRFRCSNCNFRLKTSQANRGNQVVCPKCKHLIKAERHANQPLPEESVIQRLDSSIDNWVRTTCTCGKLIKAPASFAGRTGHCPQCGKTVTMPQLGETVSSSLEVSTLVEAPSEESLLMAVNQQDPASDKTDPQAPADPTKIKYSRITPPSDPESAPDEQFIRAACICGAEVHALPSLAGKVIDCPKCKRMIHLPHKPKPRPVFDFDAMGRKDLSFGGESQVFSPEDISAGPGGDLLAQIDQSKATVIPVTQAEWNREKQARAINIRKIRGANRIEIAIDSTALAVTTKWENFRQTLRDKPGISLAVAAVAVVAGSIVTVVQYNNHWRGVSNAVKVVQPASKVQFYDTASGKLFTVMSDTLPPAHSPDAGATPTSVPTGFRAYRFTCGSCASASEDDVGFIESMRPEIKSGWERRMQVTGVLNVPSLLTSSPQDLRGRLISETTTIKWVDASSKEGQDLISKAKAKPCPGGQTVTACD
jgi:ssDNA-binding Zn-finger/Zn-ribbon topoisomerase 1